MKTSNQFEIKQQFGIESARHLPLLPEHHPCKRMHGHSFKITLTLRGPLDPQKGWLRDFHEIEQTMKPILQRLDHRILNDVPGLDNPTSEILCRWIYEQAKPTLLELFQVSVSETPNTECSYPVL